VVEPGEHKAATEPILNKFKSVHTVKTVRKISTKHKGWHRILAATNSSVTN